MMNLLDCHCQVKSLWAQEENLSGKGLRGNQVKMSRKNLRLLPSPLDLCLVRTRNVSSWMPRRLVTLEGIWTTVAIPMCLSRMCLWTLTTSDSPGSHSSPAASWRQARNFAGTTDMLLDLSQTKWSTVIVVQRRAEEDFCKSTFTISFTTKCKQGIINYEK